MAYIKLNSKDKTFADGYTEFLGFCKARNLRPATMKHYNEIVNNLWYKYRSPEEPIKTINKNTVNEFVEFCRNRGQKDVTVNTNLRGIRAVLYYFMTLGYCEDFKIPDLKFDKEPIETYTDEEIKLLLIKPDLKKCRFTEYRSWVACNFLLATGARLSTMLNMLVKDLDFDNDLISYRHTKNRLRQVVPMSTSLKRVLLEYVSHIPQDGYLFPNSFGDQLAPVSMTHAMQNYAKRRGVMKTGIHRWRHTFAKKWIIEGGDVFRLQKMLGHSDMDVVKNYINMFTDDLKRDFDTFNPLEQMTTTVRKHINVRRR